MNTSHMHAAVTGEHAVTLLGNVPSDWCELEHRIAHHAESFGFDQHELMAVRISLQEALANAVLHGNRCDPNKEVTIQYSIDDEGIRICVTDQGDGFDPEMVPDPRSPDLLAEPGGRGLLMMRHLMTEVRFNAGGNSVQLWKRREHHG